MFKISYLVNDGVKLGDALPRPGIASDLQVTSVEDQVARDVRDMGIRSKASANKNFCDQLKLQKGYQFRLKDIAELMPKLGYKKSSAWYVLTTEVKAKRVKRVRTGLYQVV